MSLYLFSAVLLLVLAPAAHSLIDPAAFLASSAPSPSPSLAPSPSPSLAPSPSPSLAPSPAPAAAGATKDDVDFIRTSCATTEYPEDCFDSLSHYAAAARRSPVRLVRIAIAVSLSRARAEAAYFSALSKQADYGADHRAASALRDCFSLFGDAVDSLHGSLKQMRSLVGRDSESFQFEMSNVQTWMSAALTNEDTCKDGFDGVPEGPVKSDVFRRVQEIEAATSNALSLVNSYATAKVSADFVSYP